MLGTPTTNDGGGQGALGEDAEFPTAALAAAMMVDNARDEAADVVALRFAALASPGTLLDISGSILATCQWWKLRVETASTQTVPFKVFRLTNTLTINY
eukprot:g16016.t1